MNERILIVDDDPIVRNSFIEHLHRKGYDAVSAASGDEALQRMEERPAHLVLLDLVMPGMSGIELLARLRERDPALPVLVLTGNGSIDTAIEAVRLNAADYLHKPCDPDMVLKRITSVLAAEHAKAKIVSERELATAMRLAEGVCRHFNNQLTAVMGYGLLLNARHDLPEDVRSCLDHVAHAARDLSGLVTRLGYFCRADSTAPEQVPLAMVIHDVAAVHERRHAVDLSVDVNGLPDSATVLCRPQQLAHMLSELIANACEASPSGGRVVITARAMQVPQHAAEQQARAVITVEDEGPGFSPRALAAAFDPFFSTKAPPGRGLGLSAARAIAQEWGGSLEVGNRAGGGAIAVLTLPLRLESEASLSPASPPPLDAVRCAPLLVIDEEENVLDVIRNMLENRRFSVIAASSCDNAQAILENDSLKIGGILLDVSISCSNPVEVYRRIRAHRSNTPIVFMSGSSPCAEIEHILRHDSGTRFLTKPFSAGQLCHIVLEIMRIPPA